MPCTGLLLPRLPKAALPLAVGTVGALIMPHNMYLQSAVVQSRYAAVFLVQSLHIPHWDCSKLACPAQTCSSMYSCVPASLCLPATPSVLPVIVRLLDVTEGNPTKQASLSLQQHMQLFLEVVTWGRLLTCRPIARHETEKKQSALRYVRIETGIALVCSFLINLFIVSVFARVSILPTSLLAPPSVTAHRATLQHTQCMQHVEQNAHACVRVFWSWRGGA